MALAAGLALLTAAARTEEALAAGLEVVAGLEEVRQAPETAVTLMLFPASSLAPAGKAESALGSAEVTICVLGLV